VITVADALEVMTVVTACHRRTGPRLDDKDVARATAATWAELFNAHRLALPDLLAAVKKRAATHADAPEPAEIIAFARGIRQARDSETGPTPEYEALCESKGTDAAELAALRRARESAPALDRPKIRDLVASLADRKAIDHA
jgi:hypothetical protein